MISASKGDRKFPARVERQVVDPCFERHNPPIEEVAWQNSLAPEIIDKEDAAVRF